MLYSRAGAIGAPVMTTALPLRLALKRGALVAGANWPVILIDFTLEALYKAAVSVPIAGGALLVTVLLGDDVRALFGEGIRSAADRVLGTLSASPIALAAFLLSVSLVALGGALIMFVIKAGTLSVLIAGERRAGDLHHGPLRFESISRAAAYNPAAIIDAAHRFSRRSVRLAVGLGVAYAAIGACWALAVWASLQLAGGPLQAVWALFVLLATSSSVVAIAAVNLGFDLLRVIVVADDCGVRAAIARLRAFLLADARQVLGIFGVVTVVLLVALAASAPAAAAFTFVALVPVVGLIAAPLQIAGWLIRATVFQYVGLSAMVVYETQYRRFADPAAVAPTPWKQHA